MPAPPKQAPLPPLHSFCHASRPRTAICRHACNQAAALRTPWWRLSAPDTGDTASTAAVRPDGRRCCAPGVGECAKGCRHTTHRCAHRGVCRGCSPSIQIALTTLLCDCLSVARWCTRLHRLRLDAAVCPQHWHLRSCTVFLSLSYLLSSLLSSRRPLHCGTAAFGWATVTRRARIAGRPRRTRLQRARAGHTYLVFLLVPALFGADAVERWASLLHCRIESRGAGRATEPSTYAPTQRERTKATPCATCAHA